jgi:hypothetical protein
MLKQGSKSVFSWSDPVQNENKRIVLEILKSNKLEEVLSTVEVEPDNLDFEHVLKIPPPKN